jgi:hypothetical protein
MPHKTSLASSPALNDGASARQNQVKKQWGEIYRLVAVREMLIKPMLTSKDHQLREEEYQIVDLILGINRKIGALGVFNPAALTSEMAKQELGQ